jgi:hypothetical protein
MLFTVKLRLARLRKYNFVKFPLKRICPYIMDKIATIRSGSDLKKSGQNSKKSKF